MRSMAEKKNNGDTGFGYESDPWADLRDKPVPDPGRGAVRDAKACRLMGVAGLTFSLLSFTKADTAAAGLAALLSMAGLRRGRRAVSDGLDVRPVRIWMALCRAAQVISVAYTVRAVMVLVRPAAP